MLSRSMSHDDGGKQEEARTLTIECAEPLLRHLEAARGSLMALLSRSAASLRRRGVARRDGHLPPLETSRPHEREDDRDLSRLSHAGRGRPSEGGVGTYLVTATPVWRGDLRGLTNNDRHLVEMCADRQFVLENRRGGNSTVGSNPTPSATQSLDALWSSPGRATDRRRYFTTAQATRAPAPPIGCVMWSSGLACTTSAEPSASMSAIPLPLRDTPLTSISACAEPSAYA